MIKPVKIQKLDPASKQWKTLGMVHANVNKAANGSRYNNSGAEQSSSSKSFGIRYCKLYSEIQYNKQLYRLVMNGIIYNINSYDDYQEEHITINLVGVSTGVRENTNQ